MLAFFGGALTGVFSQQGNTSPAAIVLVIFILVTLPTMILQKIAYYLFVTPW
jgi:hypothetical protein